MTDIINNIPLSEEPIQNSVESLIKKINSDRLTRDRIYWTYRTNQKRGYERDLREDTYNYFTKFGSENNSIMEEFKKFHSEKIKDRNYTILVLGDKKSMNTTYLKTLGKYEQLSIEDVFGY